MAVSKKCIDLHLIIIIIESLNVNNKPKTHFICNIIKMAGKYKQRVCLFVVIIGEYKQTTYTVFFFCKYDEISKIKNNNIKTRYNYGAKGLMHLRVE